jgi:hypothetical protein
VDIESPVIVSGKNPEKIVPVSPPPRQDVDNDSLNTPFFKYAFFVFILAVILIIVALVIFLLVTR